MHDELRDQVCDALEAAGWCREDQPTGEQLDVIEKVLVPGGWDGVLVSFGEGCDDNTIDQLLCRYDCTHKLTVRDQYPFTVTDMHIRWSENRDHLVLQCRRFFADQPDLHTEPMEFPFDDILRIEVY
jgi:hypothetical protein